MQDISVALEKRDVVGKQVRGLRREGMVPAVIHDHGKPSVHVMAPYMELAKTFSQAGKHHPVHLTVAGKKYLAMIKDADFEPKKHQLRHVVFNAIAMNEKVEAEVPVHVRYDEDHEVSPAERAGLIVLHGKDTVEVEALPANLPDALYFNGEGLVEVGDTATVADLEVPEGVDIKTESEQVLATVYEPIALQAANDAAGGDAEEETLAEDGEEGAEATEGDAAGSTPKDSKEEAAENPEA